MRMSPACHAMNLLIQTPDFSSISRMRPLCHLWFNLFGSVEKKKVFLTWTLQHLIQKAIDQSLLRSIKMFWRSEVIQPKFWLLLESFKWVTEKVVETALYFATHFCIIHCLILERHMQWINRLCLVDKDNKACKFFQDYTYCNGIAY